MKKGIIPYKEEKSALITRTAENDSFLNSIYYAAQLYIKMMDDLYPKLEIEARTQIILEGIRDLENQLSLKKVNDSVIESLELFAKDFGKNIEAICSYHDEHRHEYRKEAQQILEDTNGLTEEEIELLKLTGLDNTQTLDELNELSVEEKELLTLITTYDPYILCSSTSPTSEFSTEIDNRLSYNCNNNNNNQENIIFNVEIFSKDIASEKLTNIHNDDKSFMNTMGIKKVIGMLNDVTENITNKRWYHEKNGLVILKADDKILATEIKNYLLAHGISNIEIEIGLETEISISNIAAKDLQGIQPMKRIIKEETPSLINMSVLQ